MNSYAYLNSPYGPLRISATSHGIRSVRFIEEIPIDKPVPTIFLEKVITQLKEYFAGDRKRFDLPIDWQGVPPFHQEVLKMVYTIPYGKTRSYKQIAEVLGKPKSSRAVGQANGKNRLAIIVPCHRVIGAKGDLTGYAYGIKTKMKLLGLEQPGSYAPQSQLFELV